MTPRLSLFTAGAAHHGHAEQVAMHRSQAWKIIVGLDTPIGFTTPGGAGRGRVVVVPPYVAQSMCHPGHAVMFLAEPGSARAPFALGARAIELVTGRAADRLVAIAREAAALDHADDPAATTAAFDELGLAGPPIDRRVRRALDALARRPDLAISEVAAALHLSDVHLRHLAHRGTGMPLRSHRLWHRMLHGLTEVMRGAELARAAATAGFADQPHFGRAVRAFLGRTPSSIAAARVLAPWALREGAALEIAAMR